MDLCAFCSSASYNSLGRCHRCNHPQGQVVSDHTWSMSRQPFRRRSACHSVYFRPDESGTPMLYHATPEDPSTADPGWEGRLDEVRRQLNSHHFQQRTLEHTQHLLQCELDRLTYFHPEMTHPDRQAHLTKILRLAHPKSHHQLGPSIPLKVVLSGNDFEILGL